MRSGITSWEPFNQQIKRQFQLLLIPISLPPALSTLSHAPGAIMTNIHDKTASEAEYDEILRKLDTLLSRHQGKSSVSARTDANAAADFLSNSVSGPKIRTGTADGSR